MLEEIKNIQQLDYNIINIIKDNIYDPFIICDKSGFIAIYNKKAETLFSIDIEHQNLLELLDSIHGSQFSDFLQEAADKKSLELKDYILTTRSSKIIKCDLIINVSNDEKGILFFITFIIRENKFNLNYNSKVNIIKELTNEIIGSDVIALIDYLKANYPLTFIEREEFRKNINQIDCLFWLKDAQGRFLIVNEKFASFIGIKRVQIEKEFEHNFLPAYVKSFYQSIENYIASANNAVILENVPVKGNSALTNHKTFEIPLSDSENNVIAVIGIAQKYSPENIEKETDYVEVFSGITDPLFIINNKTDIIYQNKESIKLLSEDEKLLKDIIDQIKQNISDNKIVSEKLINVNGNYYIDILKNIFLKEENSFIVILHKKKELDIETFVKNGGKMFEQLVKNNPEPIYIYDKENLRFLEVNDAALKLYGYRKDEFLQMDLTDLYTPDDIQTLLSDNLNKDGKFSGPYRQKKKDGTSIFVQISRIGFMYNNTEAHFNLIKNMTEVLELEKQNQLFKSSFENTSECIFITDSNGFILNVNNAVTEVLGYSSEELNNSSLVSLVSENDRGQLNNSIFYSENKKSVNFETKLKKKNKELIDVDLISTPIFDYKGEIDSFTIIVKQQPIDLVTDVKNKIENVTENTAPIVINREYFSGIFHEILTPINVILGFAQEIVESIEKPNEEQKEAADIISQSRNTLLSTMNSIIEYSELAVKKPELSLSKFTIVDVLEKMHDDIKELNKTFNHTFGFGKVSSSLVINSDREKFHKLLDVILKIAAQLNKGSKTALSVAQFNLDNFIILLKTTNSTLPKLLAQIFSGEEQGAKKDYGISRITSRLANLLLESLNGKFILKPFNNNNECGFVLLSDMSKAIPEAKPDSVDVKSNVVEDLFEFDSFEEIKSKNNLFSDDMPIKVVKKSKESSPILKSIDPSDSIDEFSSNDLIFKPSNQGMAATNEFDLSNLSCLYIEDQLDSQMLFKNQMKGLKDIRLAVSFEDAVPELNKTLFDFIVLDINLQGEYNGLDALKLIHKMPKYRKTPIIAVTAYVLPGDKEKFIIAGFNAFISKPVFRTKIIEALQKIM